MAKKITELTELAETPAQTDVLPLVDLSATTTKKVSVQNLLKAAKPIKLQVRVATTAALTLATDFENGDTVDGVVLATGDRILIKNQATGADNGIYTVNAMGAPTRADDFNEDADVVGGLLVTAQEGTANADRTFILTNNGSIVVGTTALTFADILAPAILDSDITAAEGFLRKTGAGAYEAIKSNLAASAAPTTGDDSGDGYAIGSLWIDTTNDKIYQATDVSVGAAVWKEISPTSGGTGEWMPGIQGPRSGHFGQNHTAVPLSYAMHKAGDGTIVIAYNVGDGATTLRVLYSTDGGYSWKATAANPTTVPQASAQGLQAVGVFVSSATTFSVAYTAADASDTVLFAKTTDTGATWTTRTSSAVTNMNTPSMAIQMTGIDAAFYIYTVSTTSVRYTKTTDAGSNFTHGTVATETVIAASECACLTTDGTTVYAIWANTAAIYKISKTTDGGSNWSATVNIFTDGAASCQPSAAMVSSTTVVVGYLTTVSSVKKTKITRSTDSGANWTVVRNPADYLQSLNAIDNSLTVGNTGTEVYILCHASGAPAVSTLREVPLIEMFVSTDSGATWKPYSGLDPMQYHESTTQKELIPLNGLLFVESGRLLSISSSNATSLCKLFVREIIKVAVAA